MALQKNLLRRWTSFLTRNLKRGKKTLLKSNFIEKYNDVASQKWIKKVANIVVSNDIISVKRGDANSCLLDGDPPYM